MMTKHFHMKFAIIVIILILFTNKIYAQTATSISSSSTYNVDISSQSSFLVSTSASQDSFSSVILQSQTSSSITDIKNTNQPAQITDVPSLRAGFKEGTQDPETKTIQFDLLLKSTITSDRVQINWVVDGGVAYFTNPKKIIQNIQVQSGGVYDIPIQLTITTSGVTELRGTIEAFAPDGTYIITVRKDFASNYSAEVLPITQAYTDAQTLSNLKTFLLVTLGIIVLITVVYLFFREFTRWLNREEKI